MGIGLKLKSAYYFLEDKWYSLLDKIDKHAPIYKVIDPIDRVIPSFVLFLLVILFLLILGGYLIRFNSPYEVTFITFDKATSTQLGGVKLSGILGEDEFSTITESDGTAVLLAQGVPKNFFESVFELFFPSNDYPTATISAEKAGYVSIKDQDIELDSKEYKLSLQPQPSAPNCSDSMVVELIDATTKDTIVDTLDTSAIKFKCANKNIPIRTVRDSADGKIDGKFSLSEANCGFIITSASAPAHQTSSVTTSAPCTSTAYQLELSPVAITTNETAQVRVYEKGTTPKKYLPGIEVTFNGINTTLTDLTDASGMAQEVVAPGTYTITISDANFYEVTPDQNVRLTTSAGQISLVEVGLERMSADARRAIYFKVLDSADNNAVENANVDLMWLYLDSNGNYYGTTISGQVDYSSGLPNKTDRNGLYFRGTFSDRTTTNMLAVLRKDGYIYKVFRPQLFKIGQGPQVVLFDKATSANSGMAKINVKAAATQKPLVGAKTFLYYDFVLDSSNIIKRVKINSDGIITNTSGFSIYSRLPAGNYSALASFDGSLSAFSVTKAIDVNQLVTFDLNIDLNAAYLKVIPLSASDLSTPLTSATVKVYSVTDSDLSNMALLETLSYNSIANGYISAGYAKGSLLYVTVEAAGYAPNSTFLNGVSRPLSPGVNLVKVKMYSCSADKNVDIFFSDQDVYDATADNPWSGNSSVSMILKGGEYFAKFDAVLCQNMNYNELLAFSKITGPASITNIEFSPYAHMSADVFTKDTNAQYNDAPTTANVSPNTHVDSYYFPPASDLSYKTIGGRGVMTASDWNANVAIMSAGTYSFVAKFRVDSTALDTDALTIKFRAKEKHASAALASETALKSVNLDFNRAIRPGFFFKINANDLQTLAVLSGGTSSKFDLFPQTANKLGITMQNNTTQTLTNGTLTIYSINGAPSNLDRTSGGGTIHFDSSAGALKKELANSVALNGLRTSQEYSSTPYPSLYNSNSSYLAIEAVFDQNTFIAYLNTRALGKKLNLDAEFLAGVKDQLFDGTIFAQTGTPSDALTIQNVTLQARRNCRSTAASTVAYSGTVPSTQITGDSFYNTIPGVYEYGNDCIDVNISANDAVYAYAPYRGTFYAGSGGAFDPSLACIDITNQNGEKDTNLEWGQTVTLIARNSCARDVQITLESGLLCSSSGVTSCSTEMKLDTGSTRTFTITGKNIQYDSSVAKPNFTDVLGFFPVLVKARYSAAANNKLVVVAKATIHLQNSNQCFAISKDSFDFLASPAAIPFEIDDACQYTQIGDFFVPKATLSSFGFDLNYGANASLASVSFSPTLTVTGSALTSSYIEKITSNVDWSAETIYAKDILPSNVVSDPTGRPLSYYKNLSFDFNSLRDVDANITKLQFRWMDVNRMAVDGNTNPFGAAIEGNIILRYTDNTSAQVTPLRNFTTYPSLACTGTAPPTCEIGSEDLGAGMANPFHFTYALFYIDIAPHLGKGIKSIDMNLIGNKDANNLEIRLLPSVSFKSMVLGPPIVSPSNTTSNISMGGPYSILNLEGVNFLVKYLKDFGTLTPAAFSNSENPKFYVSSNNPNIAAWVENGLLKARYVGSDISSFNDGSIEMKISRTFGQGQNYGTITIEDYVDPRLGAGRTVSGAN